MSVMSVDLDDLLAKTSRTFALAIPMLPEPTRQAISVSYLLFRIADTFEDATAWPRARRLEALADFAALLTLEPALRTARAEALVAAWLADPPVAHQGYLELLAQTEGVIALGDTMPEAVRHIIARHAIRTAQGMAQVVARADERGNLRLTSVKDLQDYCYIVAGIVGELLTEVFLHDAPSLQREASALTERMATFGEALQLVNILKDSGDDARDGRVYLPPSTARADIFALARRDIEEASQYVLALQRGGAPRGYLAFTGTTLVLANASLDQLERHGPGAKVSRTDVARLVGALEQDLEAGARLDLLRRASAS